MYDKKITCFCLLAILVASYSFAQVTLSPADSLQQDSLRRNQQTTQQVMQKATWEDYKLRLAQLHIDPTRPEPSGNPQAPNADESKASSGKYHLFAGNVIKYAGPLTFNDLPVDAHELVVQTGYFDGS